jgi:hypothetical protein
MEQQLETKPDTANSAKAPAKPDRSGAGHKLPDVASLPQNAVNREGRRVRKSLR